MKIHPALLANVYRFVATADRPARPSSSARPSRCLIDEGCRRVPPRGVRSRMASSWEAIC